MQYAKNGDRNYALLKKGLHWFVDRGTTLSRPSFVLLAIAFGLLLSSLYSTPAQAQTEPEEDSATLFLPAVATDADEQPITGTDEDVLPVGVLWQADMETGDLSQWRIGTNSKTEQQDSGLCYRPTNGVSNEQAHSGSYSMKMTIDSRLGAGCRQFRKVEPPAGYPLYYSAWFYIPQQTHVGNFWNIMQFKSKLNDESGLFWKLDVRNFKGSDDLGLMLEWKGPIAGPHAGDGISIRKYESVDAKLPVGEWFKLEVYLKQSEQFDGQITVWIDGEQVYDVQNVRTRYPGGEQNWSVNNYGKGLSPNPADLYIDDVVISSTYTGP